MIKRIIFLIVLFFTFFIIPKNVLAQDKSPANQETLEGTVVEVIREDIKIVGNQQNLIQDLQILITKGSLKDQKIVVKAGSIPLAGQPKYKIGDQLLITKSFDFEGNQVFYISDFIRRKALLFVFIIFLILAIIIGKWRGVTSLIGLLISFIIIFKFILPQIYGGKDPVLIVIVASFIILPVNFFLSHGFNKKTSIALISTLIALIITGILAKFFVDFAHLTGYASEEVGFLQVTKGGIFNTKGLLLAGIIIGTLGILDDITVSQSAIVQQLKESNPKINKKELFTRSMNVGKDHIASMINTLILVYTGAALPLLLLFIDNPQPFGQIINYEIITEEIIRALIGSSGLILAVPITTFLATLIFINYKKKLKK